MDDIDNACGVSKFKKPIILNTCTYVFINNSKLLNVFFFNVNYTGRDSSKSDILEVPGERPASQPQFQEVRTPDSLTTSTIATTTPSELNSSGIPSKSSSNKSIRKCKLVPDFEVLPEDVEAVIPPDSKRRSRNPPSPLNLNLNQVNFI